MYKCTCLLASHKCCFALSSAYSKRTCSQTSPTVSTRYSDKLRDRIRDREKRPERRHTSAESICWEGLVSRMNKAEHVTRHSCYVRGFTLFGQHGPSTITVTESEKKHLDFSMTIRMMTLTNRTGVSKTK